MEIEEYLRQKEKRLEKGKERIRDFRVFDFNYLPDKPLMRQELKPIVDALLRYEKTGIANHLLVFAELKAPHVKIFHWNFNFFTATR